MTRGLLLRRSCAMIAHSPILVTKGSNCSLPLRGSTEQLMGAMDAGRASQFLCSSPSLTLKECSRTA